MVCVLLHHTVIYVMGVRTIMVALVNAVTLVVNFATLLPSVSSAVLDLSLKTTRATSAQLTYRVVKVVHPLLFV